MRGVPSDSLSVLARSIDLEFDAAAAVNDEHARWRLYQEALGRVWSHGLLREALRLESEVLVVAAVVHRALESTDPAEHHSWLSLLGPGRLREKAEAHAGEVVLLNGVLDGLIETEKFGVDILAGSVWLQLRVAGACNDHNLLEAISRAGATRRVRALASGRMAGRLAP